MKAVIYVRVSSKEQEEEGFSIPAQLKLLQEYAQRHGIQIVHEFKDVETARCAGRAQFAEMLKFLRAHPDVKAILVEKTDRLYRNFKDYVTMEELDREIHLVKEGEILSKESRSHAKLVHAIKVVLAKNYIDNLSEEVKKGMREKAEGGNIPGHAPFGYKNNPKTTKIEIDQNEAPIVKRIFELCEEGLSLRQIRIRIKEQSLRNFHKSQLHRILTNPVYYGDFVWGKELYKGNHIPIISKKVFDHVQEILTRGIKPKSRKSEFAYAGLLRCSVCGCAYTAENQKGYHYYRCTGHKGKHGAPYLREDVLESKLGEILKGLQMDDERLGWIREALEQSHQDEMKFREEMIKQLQAKATKLRNRLDQAYEDKLDGCITEQEWREKSRGWKAKLEDLRRDIARHEAANQRYYEEGIKILELAQHAYNLWLKQDRHQKRKLLNFVVSNINVDHLTIYPTYRKPFDILAEAVQTNKWGE